jgi:alkanesulfonate monooxygenase SsuD/methylene tetrahydromethanopterin reductase-like flavin-dependent oxidoreductase (luciferase family)
VKIGVALPHYGTDPSLEDVVSVAKECERLGYDSVWVSDHLAFDLAKYGGTDELLGSLEPLTTLTAIARETSTIRLGTMVLCNEFRHPVQLAKEAVTLGAASGGRFELGIGAGWYEREFRMAGLTFPRAGVRLQRLGEAVTILRRAFGGEPFSFAGKHYVVDGMVVRPRPALPPAIWVGGKGDRAMRLIASLGEGWNAAWFQEAEAYAERASLLGDAPVRRSIGQYAQGSAQEMIDRLASFAALDVEMAVLCFSSMPFGLDDPDDVARFAQDVLPAVRGSA